MSRTHLLTRTSPFLLAALLATSCSDGHAAEVEVELEALPALAQTEPAAAVLALPEDVELAPWRVELLELAADTAGAIPAYPHLKTQAQLQQDVVEVCVELDQPRRALATTQRIGNWRRGVGYADLASWLAERGIEQGLDELVALAEVESRLEGEENPQDWQRDLIRSKLAVALLKLGRVGDAALFEHDLEDSEVGRVAAAKASLFEREELEARLVELDSVLPAANLDQMRSALLAGLQLYERGLEDDAWRARC